MYSCLWCLQWFPEEEFANTEPRSNMFTYTGYHYLALLAFPFTLVGPFAKPCYLVSKNTSLGGGVCVTAQISAWAFLSVGAKIDLGSISLSVSAGHINTHITSHAILPFSFTPLQVIRDNINHLLVYGTVTLFPKGHATKSKGTRLLPGKPGVTLFLELYEEILIMDVSESCSAGFKIRKPAIRKKKNVHFSADLLLSCCAFRAELINCLPVTSRILFIKDFISLKKTCNCLWDDVSASETGATGTKSTTKLLFFTLI